MKGFPIEFKFKMIKAQHFQQPLHNLYHYIVLRKSEVIS